MQHFELTPSLLTLNKLPHNSKLCVHAINYVVTFLILHTVKTYVGFVSPNAMLSTSVCKPGPIFQTFGFGVQ